MAMTGTLEADFSSFDAAVKSSEAKLQAFEGSSNKVAAALTKITDETPPRLAKLGASVGDVGAGAEKALGPVNSLREVTGQFDSVLASMGVNVGGAARSLAELGDASGKTVGELGLVGSAGLVVGAAMAGWQLGRVISDVLGLDAAIGGGVANLLGFGTEAEQAGIKADALALATARSGRAVTDYSDALQINNEFLATWASNVEEADKKLQLLNAPGKMKQQIAEWDAEMLRVIDGGSLPGLDAALKAQDFTVQEIAKSYGISEAALQHYVKGQHDAIAATNESTKAFADQIKQRQAFDQLQQKIDEAAAKRLKDAADAAAKWAAGMLELTQAGHGLKGIVDGINGSVVEAIKFYLDAGVSQQTLAQMYGLTALQVRAIADAYKDETAAHTAATAATKDDTVATAANTVEKQKAIEMVHTLAGAYISLADAQRLHDMGGSATIPNLTPAQVERMGGRAEIERQVALGRPQNPGTNTAEGYADLARRQAAFEAMVRYLATVGPAAQQVTTSFATLSSTLATVTGGGGGGGAGGRHGSVPVDPYAVGQPMQETDRLLYTLIDGIKTSPPTVNVSINVSGVLDPRTRTELTEAVSEEIMRNLRLGRQING